MPKLQDHDVARNKRKIEDAALRLFTRQGYHGTSIREIADQAAISVGNIYNYYRTKEEIFVSVVNRYEGKIEELRRKAIGPLTDLFHPRELERLARSIREIVYDNPDYWRLMYLDVIEFGSRHFAHTFRSLAAGLKARLGNQLVRATRNGKWRGIDPALAFTAIYLQFFTYYLVEKLFGGKQHLGVADDRAIAQLILMQTRGIWREDPGSKSKSRKRSQR
jgi:AcrR family transcriptional regulator